MAECVAQRPGESQPQVVGTTSVAAPSRAEQRSVALASASRSGKTCHGEGGARRAVGVRADLRVRLRLRARDHHHQRNNGDVPSQLAPVLLPLANPHLLLA